MDITETYIKMCKKAEEIQKLWKLTDWDYCYCQEDEKVVVLSGYETDSGFYGHYIDWDYINLKLVTSKVGGCRDETEHIWLPRQDQLQEMIKKYPLELLDKFHTFCMWRENMLPVSMEQLWLAFVMREKYKKIWEGDKWTIVTTL